MSSDKPRAFLFAYGVLAYRLFVVVFDYLAGFLTEFLVPKAINDPTSDWQAIAPHASDTNRVATPDPYALWINLGLIALFGVTHSALARDWFKRRLTKIVPAEAERSTYVLRSSLCLALAIAQWRSMSTTVWQVEGLATLAIYSLLPVGAGILLLSTFLIDHFELFGLCQVWSKIRNKSMPLQEFKTPMLYRVVRHPMQLGIIIMLFSTAHMTVGHLLSATPMTAYIYTGL